MYVIFDRAEKKDLAMVCFYNDREKQTEMMHRQDVDKQVKEWQQTNSGNPPTFYSRIKIKEFTNRNLNFSNI
jgi:hypothetical protein